MTKKNHNLQVRSWARTHLWREPRQWMGTLVDGWQCSPGHTSREASDSYSQLISTLLQGYLLMGRHGFNIRCQMVACCVAKGSFARLVGSNCLPCRIEEKERQFPRLNPRSLSRRVAIFLQRSWNLLDIATYIASCPGLLIGLTTCS